MAGFRAQKIRKVRQFLARLPRLPQARFSLCIALVLQVRVAQREIGSRSRLARVSVRIGSHSRISLRRAQIR